ncbi:MAG: phospholipid carrier-dependent glycosyltransferase [Candidatus Omnitrophica bacterium]|nr:phospholipid carrier-dependent glycosyltransferase [Candidatus Omnitrophota bacterium]
MPNILGTNLANTLVKISFIAVLFTAFYSLNIGYPSFPYFDEAHYVPAARGIASLTAYTETTHPPLGKILIAGSIRVFSDQPWAWRLPSLVLGGFATALAGYLAFMLSGSWVMFWLTSFLLMLDGLWITQARAGLLNTPMVFFILSALILWRQGHAAPAKRRNFWIAAAICSGLAAACKWQGTLVILIPPLFYLLSGKAERPTGTLKGRWTAYLLLAMIGTYFLTFLIIPFIQGMGWSDIWRLQYEMAHYHLYEQNEFFRYQSPWYTWPFLIRPIWFGFLRETPNLPLSEQVIRGTICLGNPAIFLLISPAMVWIAAQWYQRRDALTTLTLTGLLVFWIPSGLVSRYTMFNHFYPALPFAIIGVAAMLRRLLNDKREFAPLAANILMLLIIFTFAFFYPLWVGLSIPDHFYRMHLWLPRWT